MCLTKIILEKVRDDIGSRFIDNCKSYFAHEGFDDYMNENLTLFDSYTEGNYADVVDSSSKDNTLLRNYCIFDTVVKANTRVKTNSFHGFNSQLIENMTDIYLRNKNYSKASSVLYMICYAFSGLRWFNELYYQLLQETKSNKSNQIDSYLLGQSILSSINSPRKTFILKGNITSNIAENCSPTLFLYCILNIAFDESNLDYTRINYLRYKKYIAKKMITKKRYDEAEKILCELSTTSDVLLSIESKKLLLELYIEMNRGDDAISFFVTTVLDNHNLFFAIDYYQVCEIAREQLTHKINTTIPIVLSLYNRFIDLKYEPTLRYSLDKYFETNNIRNISDLCTTLEKENCNTKNYFLEYVCVPSILKLVQLLRNTNEIEDFRISICSYLIENNVSRDKMVTEVQEITKEQIIRRGLHHVNQNRIFAEMENISKKKNDLLYENYQLFTNLIKKDFSSFQDEKEMKTILSRLNDKVSFADLHMIHLVDLQLNEKNELFYKICSLVRDEFVYGERGLNSSLSTRIRHGVLPTALRECAANENIITTIHKTTMNPQSNLFWKMKLVGLSNDSFQKIDKCLSDFTLAYEQVISDINDKWLQVVIIDKDLASITKLETHKQALFNYSVSAVETYYLQSLVLSESYESFIRSITEWLWVRTEQNLIYVREKLNTSARPLIKKCFEDLLNRLDSYRDAGFDITLLIDAVNRSRDFFNTKFDNIVLWFNHSKSSTFAEFAIDIAIEIAARPVAVHVKHTDIDKTLLFSGVYLNSIVDILYILFENCVSKSGLTKEDLLIELQLKKVNTNNYILTIINNCSDTIDINSANDKLLQYRKAIEDSDFASESQKEGGTGIVKIKKILTKDLMVNNSMVFFYKAPSFFEIAITFEWNNGEQYETNIDH